MHGAALHLKPGFRPAILGRGPGFIFLDKPPEPHSLELQGHLEESQIVTWLRSNHPIKDPHVLSTQQVECATSGVVFVPLWRSVADEFAALQNEQLLVEVYTALVRGHLPLDDIIRCHRRLCKPSEGSTAWRLAGNRRQGREACTLIRGLQHGLYKGQHCTLVELRPVTAVPQQLRLHCVSIGHPIIGDELHAADRHLYFRYERPLTSPRIMLHCWQMYINFREGSHHAISPDRCRSAMDTCRGKETSETGIAHQQLNIHNAVTNNSVSDPKSVAHHDVTGLTAVHTDEGMWGTFAGGISAQIVDDTHWDFPLKTRRIKGPPYGPPEFDHRSRSSVSRHGRF